MADHVKRRAFVFAALFLVNVQCSQDVMKQLTVGFTKALSQCRAELNVGEEIMQDFYNFWREDYAFVNRDLGCVVMCIASKFDLITEDMKLHHQNAQDFAKSHGADDSIAKQLVEIIHGCEGTHSSVVDDCSRVLEIAKCFKTKIHDLKWAPTMEVVLEEVMTELKQ